MGFTPRNVFLSFCVLYVCVLTGLYFSHYNRLRNILASPEPTANSTANYGQKSHRDKSLDPLLRQNFAHLFGAESVDSKIYQTKWTESKIAEIPYRKKTNEKNKLFLKKDLSSNLFPEKIGDLFSDHFFAGVAAGDLNHDGLLDVVLSSPHQPLKILVNRGGSQFQDFSDFLIDEDLYTEHAVLADFDGDSYLDLLVMPEKFDRRGDSRAKVYWFDSTAKKFKFQSSFSATKGLSGGASVADINADGFLDIYLSYGVDWEGVEHFDVDATGEPSQLWISSGSKLDWTEKFREYFPPEHQNNYQGMTVLFSDFNQDGTLDFLFGNDMSSPSVTLLGSRGSEPHFQMVPRDFLPYNGRESMSYFSFDANNDGRLELWENCVSTRNTASFIHNGRKIIEEVKKLNRKEPWAIQAAQMLEGRLVGIHNCPIYTDPYVQKMCRIFFFTDRASVMKDENLCNSIDDRFYSKDCRAMVHALKYGYNPTKSRINAELFPKQLNLNALLQYDQKTGKYKAILDSEDALYTAWSWAAFPYDLNNDGFQDLFVTNGALAENQINLKRVLINESTTSKIAFKNRAREFGLDLPDEARGTVVADFDLDGDGDIVMNNVFTPALHLENQTNGDSLQIELRSHAGNYYALGAKILLKTTSQTQIREISQGGIWNTSQPYRAHFGLNPKEQIQLLEIQWPNGNKQTISSGITKNHLYVIYE